MVASDPGSHTAEGGASSLPAASLKRANSRSRGINIKTVSPTYPIRPSADSEARKDLGRIRTSSINSASTSSSSSSPGAFAAGTAGADLRSFHSNSSMPTLDSDHSSISLAPKQEYRRSNSFGGTGSYDFALPPAAELSKLNINEQLRLLALKEMSVVEMRDSIANMKSKLHDSESDLTSLRQLIQKSLYRELNLQHQATQRMPMPKQSNVVSSSGTARAPLKPRNKPNEATGTKPLDQRPQANSEDRSSKIDRSSKLWANLSKPITFIQNLDSMLSNEFEKSLVGDLTQDSPGHPLPRRNSQSRHPSKATPETSQMKPPNEHHTNQESNKHQSKSTHQHLAESTDIKHTSESQLSRNRKIQQNLARNGEQELGPGADSNRDISRKDTDDMFYAVSNSLWSFVNEVKTNVISTINENAEHYVSPPKSPPLEGADEAQSFSPLTGDHDDIQDFDKSGDEDTIDFSMYASMRRTK